MSNEKIPETAVPTFMNKVWIQCLSKKPFTRQVWQPKNIDLDQMTNTEAKFVFSLDCTFIPSIWFLTILKTGLIHRVMRNPELGFSAQGCQNKICTASARSLSKELGVWGAIICFLRHLIDNCFPWQNIYIESINSRLSNSSVKILCRSIIVPVASLHVNLLSPLSPLNCQMVYLYLNCLIKQAALR